MLRLFSVMQIVLLLSFSIHAQAAGGRADYDIDDDGLIEINDLSDLNGIRNHLDGTALYGSSAGCPAEGCNGFELTGNLDFDTNSDGVLDIGDSYWNRGVGWSPIGNSSNPLTATFEGNGFEIRNLMINKIGSGSYQSLFAYAVGATIQNLGMTGALGGVSCRGQFVGAVVGRMVDTKIINVYSFLDIKSNSSSVGGLVGSANGNSLLRGVFSNGHVQGDYKWTGGLVGRSTSNSVQIQASYFAGLLNSTGDELGGISGFSYSEVTSSLVVAPVVGSATATQVFPLNGASGTATNSYWATDTVGLSTSASGGVGVTQAELACPTTADDNSCAAVPLYVGWSNELDASGNPYWNFGGNTQLPALVINGRTLRDSDSDGRLDVDDAFPQNFAASVDTDNDGAPDRWHPACDQACIDASGLAYDYFPLNAAVSQDTDLDGLPEAWNAGCDSTCQGASGLILDSLPNDSDNDGLTNDVDEQDYNAANDGAVDADADSDGLIDISTLVQLDAIRFNRFGLGRQLEASGVVDSSGCPARLFNSEIVAICQGYELLNNLDFDTNNDGVLNVSDSYWNDGAGWVSLNNGFAGIFDGNGFEIRNLMINQPSKDFLGLFSSTNGAIIQNLGLTGSLGSVSGGVAIAALAGAITDSTIISVYSTLRVMGTGNAVGGLIGSVRGKSLVRGVFSNGYVQANNYAGGLIGDVSTPEFQFQVGFFAGKLSSIGDQVGGLMGRAFGTVSSGLVTGPVSGAVASTQVYPLIGNSGTLTNSYWATDTVGLNTSVSGGIGATTAELACPVAADDSACAAAPLYVGWSSELDAKGNPYWDFGSNTQLPALVINGRILRDSDNDGQLDGEDAFPQNFAAAIDSDNDGSPDRWNIACDQACIDASGLNYDYLPMNAAAALDTDFDGFPDAWNAACDATCQGASGLILDSNLNDSDNDGLTNDVDDQDYNAANDGQLDADADSDGLLDISTVQQLDVIRFNLSGQGRQLAIDGLVDSSGCPARLVNGEMLTVCNGYELLNDLNFDTNSDGVLDANDSYWNGGEGWLPLGSNTEPFTASFDGNGFEIRNLMINRASVNQALFSSTKGASIQNLGLTGELGSVSGTDRLGALAGSVVETTVMSVYSTLRVQGSGGAVGGLIGEVKGRSLLRGVFSSSYVQAGGLAGGLVGSAISADFQIQVGLFSGTLSSIGDLVGGLTGHLYGAVSSSLVTGSVSGSASATRVNPFNGPSGTVTNSYWATDTVGLSTSASGGIVATTVELACPVAADDSACAAAPLYVGWSSELDAKGNPYWDFGSNTQLPALVINGRILRDSDNDGQLDGDDAFPQNFAAAIDSDSDGSPDRWNPACDQACIDASGLVYDGFPLNAAAALDTDLDGLPDAWNASCDVTCQGTSGLILDSNLNDSDNDGLTNDVDEQDLNAANDGAIDADADSDGLLDISTLQQLDAIRFNLSGQGRQLASDDLLVDSSGCPARPVNGEMIRVCDGYELLNDLNFDTNTDGVLDANDSYWNGGAGWQSVGSTTDRFTARFDGRGFEIRNLMISKTSYYQGLFAATNGASIQNLGLTGELGRVSGSYYVGAVVGFAGYTTITDVYSTLGVKGQYLVGGLVGYASGTTLLRGVFSNGYVEGFVDVGGLVGSAISAGAQIQAGLFSGAIISTGDGVGGLAAGSSGAVSSSLVMGSVSAPTSATRVGPFNGASGTVTNSYWSTDTVGLSDSVSGGVGATRAELTCPVAADDSTCAAVPLYVGWSNELDSKGNAYWDFGSNNQLPALIVNGRILRDSDADGVLDLYINDFIKWDAFPLDAAASVDTDGDGQPDSWNVDCDTACQENSTLVLDGDIDGDNVINSLDAFPLNAAASADTDGDGLPDDWNLSCDVNCQSASNLVIDTDDDNDGVLDIDDPDNGADNGLPVITSVLEVINVSATGVNTMVVLDANMVVAIDAVDATLEIEASLNNQLLALNAQGEVALPSGALSVEWVAIDDAGNRSEPVIQLVNVYPLVSFELTESMIGEESEALLAIKLSGPSPVYPVNITFNWLDFNSTADAGDVLASGAGGIDLSALTVVIASAEELTTAALKIPVINDGVEEVDEALVFEISAASAGENVAYGMPIEMANMTHVLTITELNLAPVVVLAFNQDGVETSNVDPAGGEVTVTATVSDVNGQDLHSFEWLVVGLPPVAADAASFVFDPVDLASGSYTISVVATDDGDPVLSSDEVSLVFTVKSSAQPATGGGGGGSLNYLFILLLFIGILSRGLVRIKR